MSGYQNRIDILRTRIVIVMVMVIINIIRMNGNSNRINE